MKTIIAATALALAAFSAMPAEAQKKTSYNYNRGVEEYENAEFYDAYTFFTKAAEENPKDAYTQLYLARLNDSFGDYEEGMTNANTAIKYLPKKDKSSLAEAYSLRSTCNIEQGDTLAAFADLDRAVSLDPKNTDYLEKRGDYYYQAEDYDASDASYRAILDIDPEAVLGFMGLGRNAKTREDWDTAIEYFNEAVANSDDYSSAYSFRAEAYIAKHLYKEATDDIITALSIDQDMKAFFLMFDLEEPALSQMLVKLRLQGTKYPTDETWPFASALLYEEAKNYPKAAEYYIKAFEAGGDTDFLPTIAKTYAEMEDYQNALKYVNLALAELDADDLESTPLLKSKASNLHYLQRDDEAIACLNTYIDNNLEDDLAYFFRAGLLAKAGRNDEALEDYATAIALDPDYAPYYLHRGDFYRRNGKTSLAERDYKTLVAIDTVATSGSCAHYGLFHLGRTDEAIAFCDSIIALDSTEVAGHLYDAACLRIRMGRNDEALDYLRQAFDKGYHSFAHIADDYDLDPVRELPEWRQLIDEAERKFREENAHTDATEPTASETVTTEVPMTRDSGIYKVACTINELPLSFYFDTGAADVTISSVEALFMLKNGFLTPKDIAGTTHYTDANGDISEGTVILLRKVEFGGLTLENVKASVVHNQKAPLLLGQTVLGRLGKIEIDNEGRTLKVTHKKVR